MKKWRLVLILFMILPVSCTQKGTTVQPPKIRYGEDMCDECKMIINEMYYAAGIVTANNSYRFDDIGCMFIFMSKHSDLKPLKYWVHDYQTGTWIDAKKAFFVYTPEVKTPMGYGLLAFQDSLKTMEYTSVKGAKLLTFDELKTNPPKEMVMQGGMK